LSILTDAKAYCVRKDIAPVPVYSAKRFVRLVGDTSAQEMTQRRLLDFVIAAKAESMPPNTIRGTVKDLITICKDAGNLLLRQCVQKQAPQPRPIPIESIEAAWPFLAPWSCQWVALAYWTGLRHDDVTTMQLGGIDCATESLRWQASKTGKGHVWPFPEWLRKHMQACKHLPYKVANDNAQVIVRGELARVSTLGKVPAMFPQHMRQRSINEWTRANATAGAIVHGMGLGVMAHYLDPLGVLESAAPRVRLPKCFGGSESEDLETTLLFHYRKLDPAAKGLIAGTAERLATG